MRRGRPSFIGGEEGLILWNMLDPFINVPNHHSRCTEPGRHLDTDIGKAVGDSPPKVGPSSPHRGAGAPVVQSHPGGAVSAQSLLCFGPLLQSLVLFGARLL